MSLDVWTSFCFLESLAGKHGEMLDDGAECERGEELQPAENEDDADEKADKERAIRWKGTT